MIIFEPIIGMIHNVKNDTWHPVYFREAPTPSAAETDSVIRYKSGGHHTTGFATREEALKGAEELANAITPHSVGKTRMCLEKAFPWDGEGVPAMVVFFKLEEETAIPLF